MPLSIDPILLELPDELLGEQVLVRPYRAGDGPAVFEAVNESREHLRRWMPWVDTHVTAADSEAFVRRSQASWINRTELIVGIWDRDGRRLFGSSGLHCRDWEIPCFEVGYWLRRSAEGHGYVSETVRLLTRFAFEILGANRVFLQCDARNTRSAAVPQRLGFVLEATLRHDARDHFGSLRDTLIFALTPDDFASLRELPLWAPAQQP